RQLQRVRGELLHRATKTQESDAPLPVPALCASVLRQHHLRQQEIAKTSGERWHDSGMLFTTRYGSPIEPRNFSRSWEAACNRAAVRKITVHDARRTCASLLVDLDVHPRIAMAILRHADVSITVEVYAQVSSQATRDALRRLGESLDRYPAAVLRCCTRSRGPSRSMRDGPLPASGRPDLNRRPLDPQSSALPSCATSRSHPALHEVADTA